MICLAIETSCDETAAALLIKEGNGAIRVLSERISSQVKIHEAYGGIVPELASREHLVNLPLMVDQVLSEAALSFQDISCLAVTRGPGLKGCLLVGLNFAKGIAVARGLPLVGVNHIEGHIYAPFIGEKEPSYPYLALIVSGGHTEIQLVSGLGQYRVIARTLDDAAGEAFDKSAHLLGLPYPGGAKLSALAEGLQSSAFALPSVMRESENFSFSGLKTAVLQLIKKEQAAIAADSTVVKQIAFSVQDAIVQAIIFKLRGAISKCGVKKVVLSGGVAANSELRKRVADLPGIEMKVAPPHWCTDNAAMIGYVGMLRYLRGESSPLSDGALARWPVEELQ